MLFIIVELGHFQLIIFQKERIAQVCKKLIMIKSLYPKFQHWAEKGAIWIISDPHFDDPDCKIINPDWPSPEEYIKQIKPNIGKHDTLICLGDVGNPKYFDNFDCYKVLITGNHDAGASKYLKTGIFVDCLWLDDAEKIVSLNPNYYIKEIHNMKANVYERVGYFDEVYEGPLFIADRILLSHEPIMGLEEMCVNIHGHTHMNEKYFNLWNHVNLAADVVEWNAFNLGKAIKNGLLSDVKNYHKLTIEKIKNI